MRASRLTLAALAVAAALLSGCTGSPEPVETTPAFASEEEAFAAAEATYRAYVDALNQVDLSDPDTFEPVFALTTGDANANERERLSQMHAAKWSLSGTTTLKSFVPHSPESEAETSALACLNVANVLVVDEAGASKVSPERRDEYALIVQFADVSGSLRISSSNAIEDDRCGH